MVFELHPRQGRVNDSLWMTATPEAYIAAANSHAC
jgi:hypothetical protein